MKVVRRDDGEAGAHCFAHAAGDLRVGMWKLVAYHGAVQGKQQAVQCGGRLQLLDQFIGQRVESRRLNRTAGRGPSDQSGEDIETALSGAF